MEVRMKIYGGSATIVNSLTGVTCSYQRVYSILQCDSAVKNLFEEKA